MTQLIVTLPSALTSGNVEWRYVLTDERRAITRHGQVSTALLPTLSQLAQEVVAIAPVQLISWHKVELPQGAMNRSALERSGNRPRLRAILEGLLEEQLLDEPAHLHFALAPQQQAGQSAWVAVCDRAWLVEALSLLEQAGLALERVVPEFIPQTSKLDNAQAAYVLEGALAPQLVIPGNQGVSVLPLGPVALQLFGGLETRTLFAEPAVAHAAEQAFKRPLELLSPEQRAQQAAQSEWNLAQFELARLRQGRRLKSLGRAWTQWRHEPQWRAARWSALVLVAVQVLGLASWVWNEQAALTHQRAALRSILLETFPQVNVVLDAPLQMQREVDALAQAAGTTTRRDLESILSALSSATSAQQSLSAIDFANGIATVKGLQLQDLEASLLISKLKAQGYEAKAQGNQWVIQVKDSP